MKNCQEKKKNEQTANCMTEDDEEDSDSGNYKVMPALCCMAHKVDEDDTVGAVLSHSFDTNRASVKPPGCVGLDSMSSIDVFGYKRMLHNVRTVRGRMKTVCNAGEVTATQKGDLLG